MICKPVVRILFKVPGRASIDLVASWFGASNAAVILTREQYMKGFYTKREAGYIMTNFSVVSIPFCLLVAETLDISHLFPTFYLTVCIVGIVLAVILCRIPPISIIPDSYQEEVGKQLNEDIPTDKGLFKHALELSCERASTFTAKAVGVIIMKSEVPLNLWKLFVIFIERTLIALPMIVVLANILVK